MKPSLIRIEAVADLRNLSEAFFRAAAGLRHRPDVAAFADGLDPELSRLGSEILAGSVRVGQARSFVIHDPKRRVIHAPVFRERVLHHALMRHIEPVLDRALVADTFACRCGKGALAAVHRVQQHLRRYPWYAQLDIRRYFDSIDHEVLLELLRRRVKGGAVLALCERIVRSYATAPGTGVPIGALTSQHLANSYLGGLDRFLLEELRVSAMVRYMDDILWWTTDALSPRQQVLAVEAFLAGQLRLEVHPPRIQRSAQGVTFCGFRVLPGTLLLSRRRRRRYAVARRRWERAWRLGWIDAGELQQGIAAAVAVTAHADAAAWRREQLIRVPSVDA